MRMRRDDLCKGKPGLAFYRIVSLGFAIYANSLLARAFVPTGTNPAGNTKPYFRSMIVDDNGAPMPGTGAAKDGSKLAPRIMVDVTPDENGMVIPNFQKPQGLSVNQDVTYIPKNLLPIEWGGTKTGRAVFVLEVDVDIPPGAVQNPLPGGLVIVQDSPTHAVISPSKQMHFQEYINLVISTMNLWKQVLPPSH